MTSLDIQPIVLQVLLPVALLAGLAVLPARSVAGLTLQIVATGLALIAVGLVMVWLAPPLWVAKLYVLAWAVIVPMCLWRMRERHLPVLPQQPSGWGVASVFAVLATYAGVLIATAISGWSPQANQRTVDLPFMLGAGSYQVANGGARELINAHLMTLHPVTARQESYRGQSYAVDVVGLGTWGMRATGWRPTDPNDYAIFGTPVYAPCDGTVMSARTSMPDMPVPQPDTSHLEGNHVFIDCGGFGVLLAHLQQQTVAVAAGVPVTLGQVLGRVGNSGQTFEPHLHIHVQDLAEDDRPFSGDPLPMTIDGVFPVRNAVLSR